MKKIFIISGFIIGLMIPIQSNNVNAYETLGCLDKYYSYISKAVSETSRGEIWKDFTRSYCQVNDLIATNDELDTLRDTFKTAAQNCEDTSEYSKKYTKLLLEQYFIRNIQKTPSDIIEEDEVEKIKSQKKSKLTKLQASMIEIFVINEGKLSEDDLISYFEEWSAKYDDSIIKYAQCNEGPWAELTDTWNKFADKMKSLEIKPKKYEYVAPEDKNSFTENISKNIVEYLEKFGDDYKESITPKPTVSEIVSTSKTTALVLEELGEGESTFNIENASAKRLARYMVDYNAGGAKTSSTFQTTIKDLNTIITDSNNVEFKQIKTRVDQIKEKQCK